MTKNHQEYIEKYFADSRLVIDALLKTQSENIGKAVDMIFQAWLDKKPVFLIGNGGSASTATHFAADLIKTVIEKPGEEGVRALALADNIPWTSAMVNDWGWDNVHIEHLRNFWQPGGVVLGISVHGGSGKDKAGAWSQNLLKAMQFAKDNGGKTIGLSGFDGGAMKNLADVCVVVSADSTPLVESFHVVLHHLITFRLKEMIKDRNGQKRTDV